MEERCQINNPELKYKKTNFNNLTMPNIFQDQFFDCRKFERNNPDNIEKKLYVNKIDKNIITVENESLCNDISKNMQKNQSKNNTYINQNNHNHFNNILSIKNIKDLNKQEININIDNLSLFEQTVNKTNKQNIKEIIIEENKKNSLDMNNTNQKNSFYSYRIENRNDMNKTLYINEKMQENGNIGIENKNNFSNAENNFFGGNRNANVNLNKKNYFEKECNYSNDQKFTHIKNENIPEKKINFDLVQKNILKDGINNQNNNEILIYHELNKNAIVNSKAKNDYLKNFPNKEETQAYFKNLQNNNDENRFDKLNNQIRYSTTK
ncbi:hypothetical protein GVAV_001785 [Gurleya vavrai]